MLQYKKFCLQDSLTAEQVPTVGFNGKDGLLQTHWTRHVGVILLPGLRLRGFILSQSDRQTDRPVSPDTPGCYIIYSLELARLTLPAQFAAAAARP